MATLLSYDHERKVHRSQRHFIKLLVLLAAMVLFAAFFSLWAVIGHYSTASAQGHAHTFEKFMPRTTTSMTPGLFHHNLHDGGFAEAGNVTLSTAVSREKMRKEEEEEEGDAYCDASIFNSKVPLADRCQYVTTHKACTGNIFLRLLYCHMSDSSIMWLWFILCGTGLLFSFYVLGSTADAYFAPSLFTMSEYLDLSPNVAGVTLLALGNSAPDLSAVMVGSLRGSSGIGVGAPLGVSMFVSCLVFGIVILISTVKVTRRPYLRDVIFLLVSVVFTFYVYIDRKVELWESISCLALYVLYVAVVVIGRAVYQRRKKRRMALKDEEMREEEEAMTLAKKKRKEEKRMRKESMGEKGSVTDEEEGQRIDEDDSDDSSDDGSDDGDWTSYWFKNTIFYNHRGDDQSDEETAASIQTEKKTSHGNNVPGFISNYFENDVMVVEGERYQNTINTSYTEHYIRQHDEDDHIGYGYDSDEDEKKSALRRLFNLFLKFIEWHERPWFLKITYVLFEGVTNLMRNITIPKGHKSLWNKWFAACVPIFSSLLLLYAVGGGELLTYRIKGVFPLAVIPLGIGIILSILILVTSRRNRAPIYFPILVCYSFVMSIVWIFMTADFVVSFLEAIGFALGINPGTLALTLLAWGNSTGDMVADLSIARRGSPAMAVGACFGGPLVAILVGLGLSWTSKILFLPTDPAGVDFWCTPISTEPAITAIFMCLIVTLVMSLFAIPISRFRGTKPYGVVLLVTYASIIVFAVTASLWSGLGDLLDWNIGRGC